jgi:hypothetical protein
MKMNLREAVLDALVDDGESIRQISEYLQYLKIDNSSETIVNVVISLMNEQLIRIVYPHNKTMDNFVNADNEGKLEFWFELTECGHKEWKKIV